MTEYPQANRTATEGELFQLLVENVQDYAIFVVDPTGRVQSWNPGAERLLGYSVSEIVGQPTSVFFTPEDVQDGEPLRDMAKAVETGRGKDDRWHVRKDGSRFWSAGTITPLWDEGHKLRGFAKIMRDCTSQKRGDDALKDALAYIHGIVDTVREPMLVLGGELRVKTANRSFYRTFQVSPEETEGRLIYDLGNRQWDIPRLRNLLEEILPRNASFDGFEVEQEFRAIGRKIMLLNARRFDRSDKQTDLILLAIEDVTERRQAEDARREIETRFTSLVKNIKDHSIFTMDLDGRITSWNVEAERILGYSEAEILGQSFSVIFTPEDLQVEMPAQELRKARAAGRAEDERWHVRKNGERFWALGIVTPTHDAGGRQTGFSKILRDMTERKLAEQALQRAHEETETIVRERTAELRTANEELQDEIAEGRRTEARKEAVLNVSLDAIISIDHEGKVVEFNPAAERTFGYSRAEMIGKELAEKILPPPLRAAHRLGLTHYLATGEGHVLGKRLELSALRADGTEFPIELVIARIPGAGLPIFIGFIRDISERKQAEAALRKSEGRFQELTTHIDQILWVMDAQEAKILYVSPAYEKVWGRSCQSLLDTPGSYMEGIHSLDVERWRLADAAMYQTGHIDLEVRILRADGSLRWIWIRGYPVTEQNRIVRIVGVIEDISEKRLLTDQRDELLSRLQLHIKHMPLAYILFDADLRICDWNPAAERMFGYSVQEALGLTLFDFVLPSFQQEAEEIIRRIRGGDMGSHAVNENLTKDGRTITCEWHNTPLLEKDGNFLGFIGLGQDVTSRREAEKSLRLRDRAIQAVTQGIVITDSGQPDNPIVYASPSFLHMTGYREEEVLGRNCRFLQGKDTDPAAVAQIRQAVAQAHSCTVELLNYRKDGTAFWNELSLAPVMNESNQVTHFVGVQTDVTQRRLLEDQFRQAQKMEAFGQLAGGVAHDFNNLLTVISGFSELLLAALPLDDRNRGMVEEIHKAGVRAGLLTRQLLAFSRKQVVQPQVLDVNIVVAGTEKMLGRLIGEDVNLTTVLLPGLAQVKVDPGQVEQVIMNLVVNARDAMPQGGQITIETANVDLDESYVQFHAEVKPGRYVSLAVSDTGCGMTEEVKLHLFEPFFTTKEVGKGTGLGLATLFGIVKQSGGHVEVYSEVGRGTTFKIYLPAVAEAAAADKVAGKPAPVLTGSETILLVEDEKAVRAITRIALETKGYKLLEAADGTEAIRFCEQHRGPIHLLVSDVVMPQMGGRLLAERLSVLHPEMRVLFVSGYTDDAVVRHGVLEAEVAFLQKPFSMDALLRKVRGVLDGAAESILQSSRGTSAKANSPATP